MVKDNAVLSAVCRREEWRMEREQWQQWTDWTIEEWPADQVGFRVGIHSTIPPDLYCTVECSSLVHITKNKQNKHFDSKKMHLFNIIR